jgi:CheY-like chemotaxis protein
VPYNLLLADDSVTIQRVIELTFADEDVTVVAVSDGDQAIERLEAAPPDIVLADIGMPGKNGYEVAQYIRQTPKLSHIPVMLLTGAFEPVDQARAAEAGCDGVLAKPFEPQMVIGRVKDLLAKGRQPAGAVDARATAPSPVSLAPVAPVPPPAPAPPVVGPPLDEYFDRLDAAFSSLSAPSAAAASPPETIVESFEPPASPLESPEIDWFSSAPAPGAPAELWDLPAPAADAASPDLALSYASLQPDAPPFAASAAPGVPAVESESELFLPPVLVAAAPVAADAPAPAAPDAPALVTSDADVVAPPEPAPAPAASAAPSAPMAPAPLTSLPAVAAIALPSLGDAFAAILAAEQTDASPSETPVWPGVTPAVPAITDALIDDVVRRVLERMSDQIVRDTTADVVSQIAERLVREEIERIKASVK